MADDYAVIDGLQLANRLEVVVQDAFSVSLSSETDGFAGIANLRFAQSRKIEDLPNDPEALALFICRISQDSSLHIADF